MASGCTGMRPKTVELFAWPALKPEPVPATVAVLAVPSPQTVLRAAVVYRLYCNVSVPLDINRLLKLLPLVVPLSKDKVYGVLLVQRTVMEEVPSSGVAEDGSYGPKASVVAESMMQLAATVAVT